MATFKIGSDGWRDSTHLDKESELEESVQRCLAHTNWSRLAALCSELRDRKGCTLSEKFSIGTENLVKLVEFEDGVKWVARVSLQDEDYRYKANAADVMKNEVANYKYLRKYTKIPVPDVYHYDTESTNEINAPYMLLTYIHGSVADECGLCNEQYQQVLAQIAKITVELASHTFPRIGHLVEDADCTFRIGKELETDEGPFETASEYYAAISSARLRSYTDYIPNNEVAEACPGLQLPTLFTSFMPILTRHDNDDRGPFCLTNRDLGLHNVLINAELKIVGVIDCDTMFAAPIHVAAQTLNIALLTLPVPGLATKKEAAKKTYRNGREMLDYFLERVKEFELERSPMTTLADAMDSDGARLVEGLESYRSMQEWSNAEWVKGYWYMYYRSTKGDRHCVEFSDVEIPGITDEDENEIQVTNDKRIESKDLDADDQPTNSTLQNNSFQQTCSEGAQGSTVDFEWNLSMQYLALGMLMGAAAAMMFQSGRLGWRSGA